MKVHVLRVACYKKQVNYAKISKFSCEESP